MLAHLDGLVRELSAERPAARSESIPDFKRLAAELVEARTNAVRLVVKGIISEQDAAKQLTELKRDEEALEARRVEHERRETHDTEEARRAAFAKLTEYRGRMGSPFNRRTSRAALGVRRGRTAHRLR